MAELLCPSCGQPLNSGRFGPVGINACQPCGSLWLTHGELEEIARAGAAVLWRLCERLRATARATATPAGGTRRCPTCRVPLAEREYSSMRGIRLTACPSCGGFWLGSDVLARVAALLTEVRQKAPAAAPGASFTRRIDGGQPPAPPHAPASQPGTPTGPAVPPAAPSTTPAAPNGAAPQPEPCPSCGQPNPARAAVCWACGRMLQGIAAGACPRCSATLHRLESERVEYSACDGCGGVWLEHGRLGALLLQPPSAQEQILKEVAKTHTGRIKKLHPEIFCPHCGLIMFVAPMGMLTQRPVATCPKCNAAFLDHGILDEIMRNRGGGW